MRHLKKFHTSRVRNYEEFDEIDCETCSETMIFPKRRGYECKSWENIKYENEIDLSDILPEISLLIISISVLNVLLYFTIMAFGDACADDCWGSKIMFSFFSLLVFSIMVYPFIKLLRLFINEEVELEAFPKRNRNNKKKIFSN